MFRPMRAIRFGSLLGVVLLIGCGQNNKPLSWSGWEKELTLDVANWEGIQERIAAHTGQVVVLDIWATW